MQVFIRSNGIEMTEALNEYIKNRLEFRLSRFTNLITKVVVSVSDENGPKGGIDTACTIRIKTDSSSELIVKNKQKDVYTAVANAVTASRQLIARHTKRLKLIKRKSIKFEKEVVERVTQESKPIRVY